MKKLRWAKWVLLLLVLPSICGCSRMVSVRGTLKVGGQALNLDKSKARVGITFYLWNEAEDKPFDSFTAVYQFEDGSFAVPGRNGKGIPPGKYHVTIQVFESYPSPNEKFKNKYADKKSPLVKEISSSARVIDLDLPTN